MQYAFAKQVYHSQTFRINFPKTIALVIYCAILLQKDVYCQQGWTTDQIKQANTADTVSALTQVEKDVFIHLNLARLFPADFIKYELSTYAANDRNASTLKQMLTTKQKLVAITWSADMQATAACLAAEQGPTKRTGHHRKSCVTNYHGECISYGMETGRDIVMQLLLDYNVPDFGHRKICLANDMNSMGVKDGPHVLNGKMAVLDFL